MGKTLFTGCRIVDADIDIAQGWLMMHDNVIVDLGNGIVPAEMLADCEIVDATGLVLMPGVIDTHVHFREPGMTQKATIASESKAAAAGGVTTYFDMPNTKPSTTTAEAWADKMARAGKDSLVNYAFFVGATPDNVDWLSTLDFKDRPGVKLFMGSTTGASSSGTTEWIDTLFEKVKAVVAVHAEDDSIIAQQQDNAIARFGSKENVPVECHPEIRSREACVESSKLIAGIARRHNHRLHLCHISTADELALLETGTDPTVKLITAETCPQYLTFAPEDYRRLGARVKCNPAIKEITDREALNAALMTGKIDTVATDHAPHLPADKEGGALTAASGMPGVQFSLPVMLEKTLEGGLTLQSVSRLMSGNPAAVFGIDRRGYLRRGYHADLVFVRALDERHVVKDADVVSPCGWTPYVGQELTYKVESTWVNGVCVYADGVFTQQVGGGAATPVSFKGI